MPAVKIIALPDVFGAEWVEPSGMQFQLAYSKGTSGVSFGLRPAGGQWAHMTIEQPERFGPLPAKNLKAWRDVG